MLDQLRNGDVVTVTKYDRLARSMKAPSEGFFVEPR
jgi:DNA invertase Pin-like site-specific DNA recombinase